VIQVDQDEFLPFFIQEGVFMEACVFGNGQSHIDLLIKKLYFVETG